MELTFLDLSKQFDRRWRIVEVRVDGRGETQRVYIELEKRK